MRSIMGGSCARLNPSEMYSFGTGNKMSLGREAKNLRIHGVVVDDCSFVLGVEVRRADCDWEEAEALLAAEMEAPIGFAVRCTLRAPEALNDGLSACACCGR